MLKTTCIDIQLIEAELVEENPGFFLSSRSWMTLLKVFDKITNTPFCARKWTMQICFSYFKGIKQKWKMCYIGCNLTPILYTIQFKFLLINVYHLFKYKTYIITCLWVDHNYWSFCGWDRNGCIYMSRPKKLQQNWCLPPFTMNINVTSAPNTNCLRTNDLEADEV